MKHKKILSFITDGKLFLLLRNNPADIKHGGDYWYTVTGSIDPGEEPKDAVTREILEETGLKTIIIKKLNFDCEYEMEGKEYLEYCFLSQVEKSEIKLSIEHIDYKWLELKYFIEELYWLGDKQEVYRELVSKSMI